MKKHTNEPARLLALLLRLKAQGAPARRLERCRAAIADAVAARNDPPTATEWEARLARGLANQKRLRES